MPSATAAVAPPFDRALLDQFPAMIWIDDAEGQCIYTNKTWLAFTGRSVERELGRGWMESMHADDRERYWQLYRECAAAQKAFDIEYRVRRHDGQDRWVLERSAPLFDERGQLTGYCAFCNDVTDRREADAARREIEEQVRLLSLATHDLVWSWDARSGRVLHNVTFTETFGAAPGDHAASLAWWQERVHPEDRERAIATFKLALETGAPAVSCEYRIRRADRAWIVVDDRACLVREESGPLVRVLGAMRDITKRKAAENERERFVRILEATTDVVCMAHPNGEIIHLNAAGRKVLGRSADDAFEDFKLRQCHPDWANEIIFEEGIPQAIAEGAWSGETALLAAEGHEIPVLQVILSHPGPDGNVEFVSTIMRDISDRKRGEIARIEAANRYDAAIRASGQLLFDWNSFTNDIAYAGDIEHFLGYAMSDMAGGLDRFRQLVHPEDLAAFDAEVQRVISTRDPFRLTYRMLRKDARVLVIEAKGYFFLDRRGDFGRMVGFLADITAQQQAQDALALAHDNLEQRVSERTAELAQANRVIYERARQQEAVAHLGQRALAGAAVGQMFNEASAVVRDMLKVTVCSVLELSPDKRELLAAGGAGWPDAESFSHVPIGRASQSGYTLLMREPVIAEDLTNETRFRVSESMRSIDAQSAISVVIQAGEEPIGVLCAVSTKRRKFTQDDAHFLQTVANVLTAAINRQRAEESIRLAREQAETANRAKSEFLSRMSHELRTPLNAILGFTQLLELDAPTPSQAESIGHISRGGAHLLALINQVLDIARIETGRLAMTPETVELDGVLREAVELIQPLAARTSVSVFLDASCQAGLCAIADRQRLMQVFHNLLSNAVKYNREHGSVTISADQQGDRVSVRIRDTGRGIAPENMSRLFIPFERLGAEATQVDGTGIGLALAQRIVVSLGGQLTAESVAGEGSTFIVALPAIPRAPAESNGADAIEETIATTALRTILYIEDQDLNLRLVERILKRQPELRLLSAMRGSLGLEIAREHRPDVILLDLNLPDLAGDEVLRRLKADPDLRDIPVVMVSADALGDRIEQLLGLGAYNYITKPYKVQDFLRIVNEALAASAS